MLYIAGTALFTEYFRDRTLTDAAFVTLESGERVYRTNDRVRRTLDGALHYLGRERALVRLLSENLKTRPEELPAKVADLSERLRAAEKELERMRAAQVLEAAAELAKSPKDVFGVQYVGHRAPDGVNGGDLRKLALDVRGRMSNDKPAVVAMLSVNDGKPGLVIALNDTAREWRLKAGDLVRIAAEKLGGRGGGKDDVAQGGGTDPAGADEALAAIEHTVGHLVTG